ncbi:MAG TPA: recombinase RecR [Bifidobacterium dentium]|nr:recombinase RecR [Bifidobacterium dentium]
MPVFAKSVKRRAFACRSCCRCDGDRVAQGVTRRCPRVWYCLSHVQFLMLLLSLTNRPRGARFIDA